MNPHKITIALAGNPNSGKTTIFNALTGAHQKVGNWSGVTVEKKEGIVRRDGHDFHIVDLPGTYSLSAYSIEEKAARDFILSGEADITCVVVDASNLDRNLYLVAQLLEMDTPLLLIFNMMDEVQNKGVIIDIEKLSRLFGVPVIPAVASRGKGIDEIFEIVSHIADGHITVKPAGIHYPKEFEAALAELQEKITPPSCGLKSCPSHWLALKLLENDSEVRSRFKGQTASLALADKLRISISLVFKDDPEMIITDYRYGFVNGALKETVVYPKATKRDLTDRIDGIILHRIFGLPILFLFLWLMFQSTFTIGAYPMDWIDTGIGMLAELLSNAIAGEGMFEQLLVDGILAGVGGVAVFLPNILILFLFIALMEDSGYMARAAFVMDRVMHAIGLHGKSFIPLLMGFGCNVPAIMGSRILESRRDRLLTIFINPFMSCSARLPIYVLFSAAFFPGYAGSVIFILYLTGIFVAVFTGLLMSKTVLKGQGEPFVMELPPYRFPTARSLVIHMWDRTVIFLKKMSGVILIGSILVWGLSSFPQSKEINSDFESRIEAVKTQNTPNANKEITDLQNQKSAAQQEYSLIARIGKLVEPVLEPLGFDWRDGVALASGLVAKEIVISTLGVLYGAGQEEEAAGLTDRIKAGGKTPLWALGIMVFALLYTPCLSTIAAIRRETGSIRWTLFSFSYSLGLAYLAALLIHQIGSLFIS